MGGGGKPPVNTFKGTIASVSDTSVTFNASPEDLAYYIGQENTSVIVITASTQHQAPPVP